MSFSTDVRAALVTLLESTLPGDYTISNVYTPLRDTSKQKYPFAMVFGPSTSAERLDYQQSDETFGMNITLVRLPDSELLVEEEVELVKEALGANPRIVLAIHDAWFSDWDTIPFDKSYTLGRLVFTCTTVSNE